MKWLPWVVLALLVAACARPQPPDEWAVERQVSRDKTDTAADAICTNAEALALGALDGADFTTAIDEMARLAAVIGATEALGALNRATAFADADVERALIHDEIVAASEIIDIASDEMCGLPIFSATYASANWALCYGELGIPVAEICRTDERHDLRRSHHCELSAVLDRRAALPAAQLQHGRDRGAGW